MRKVRLRRVPPFDPGEVAEPICKAMDALVKTVPSERVLEVLDEIIAYGELRFSEAQREISKYASRQSKK